MSRVQIVPAGIASCRTDTMLRGSKGAWFGTIPSGRAVTLRARRMAASRPITVLAEGKSTRDSMAVNARLRSLVMALVGM
ncbi:MAG: hypothetical protein ACJATT_004129 [Myxococcota bacterium]|jgi:hypothetical protein